MHRVKKSRKKKRNHRITRAPVSFNSIVSGLRKVRDDHPASLGACLTSFELDHAIEENDIESVRVLGDKRVRRKKADGNSPLSPLLVQHTVTALLAANVLTATERHARRAVTANVDDRGAVDSHTAAALGKGVLATHGGDLVSFAGHF